LTEYPPESWAPHVCTGAPTSGCLFVCLSVRQITEKVVNGIKGTKFLHKFMHKFLHFLGINVDTPILLCWRSAEVCVLSEYFWFIYINFFI